MRRKRSVPAILGLLSVLGLLSTGAAAQDGAPPADVDSLRLSALPGKAKRAGCKIRVGSGGSRRATSFSATEVLDLDFEIRLKKLRGDHLLRLDLFTPHGHLYQSLTVPFSTDASKARSTRRVEGFARPLAVQTAVPAVDEAADQAAGDDKAAGDDNDDKAWRAVTARLPVAGTSIVHASLYGEWTARAYLDEETSSCGRALAFRIEP